MSLQFDFNVPLTQLKNVRVKHNNGRSIHNEPRLRKSLLLAYQVEQIISEGRAKDFTQAARWLNITQGPIEPDHEFTQPRPFHSGGNTSQRFG